MITIIPANENDITRIQAIADIAWPAAFEGILIPRQIEYMMSWMYSTESIREQMNRKHHRYVLLKYGETDTGYMSYELNCANGGDSGKTKIHKIYLLPGHQGKGLGKQLIYFAEQQTKQNGGRILFLNVNKHNEKAIEFYKKLGFRLVGEEVIEIGSGFVMDDYVFEKTGF